jgi:tetratricopeptide (TPR) repeat protein
MSQPRSFASLSHFLFCIPILLTAGLALAEPPVLQLEAPPAPLDPKQPQSEAERDKAHAAALLATGRVLEQRGEMAGALRKYQRAYRYASPARPILREVVPLAFSLGRNDEAVRYALIAAEDDPSDSVLLRRLAMYLAENGEWERALKFYGFLLKHEEAQGKTPDAVEIHMEVGRLNFLTEQYAAAADAFALVDEALRDPKKFGLSEQQIDLLTAEEALTWQLFGECYIQAGKLDQAEAAYRQAHRAEPNQGQLGYYLARIEAKRNKHVEALEHLNQYFADKLDTDGVDPYELLVELLGDLNQQEAADERLEQLRADDPQNGSLGYFLAERYLKADKIDKAETILRAIAARPGENPPLAAYQRLMEVYRRANRAEPLLEVLGTATDKAGSLEIFDEEIEKLVAAKKPYNAVMSLAEKRLGDKTLTGPQALAAAQLAMLAEDFRLAAKFYERAVAAMPDRAADLVLSWGLELLLADQSEASAKVFQRGVDEKLLPADDPTLYFYLAGALAMADKTDEALVAARAAAQREPDSAEFAGRAAWIEYHGERYDDAIASYQKLLKKFDGQFESSADREALREARLVLSNIYVEKDDLPQAEEWLEQVLDEFPEDIGAQNDLGYLWADQGKHLNRALAMIQKAVAAEPDNEAYLDSLGWAYYRLGRFAEAVEPLEKAAAGEEPDGVILDHLADAYAGAGQIEKAQATWKRAVAAFEKEEDQEKAKAVREKLEKEANNQ